MSNNKNKSAKDLAFDRERVKYRREIRSLESIIGVKDAEIKALNDTIDRKNAEIREKDEWIERLLEFMNMDRSDMKSYLESEKLKMDMERLSSEAVARMSHMFDVLGVGSLFR